ncbi:MAG: CoA-binding protein, partial [Anaerolineaceae bacterium]|nr:CoA-binding protein [Anaerolineaceae bacterium]
KEVDQFLALKKIAVVGVSRSKAKFGNMAYNDLKSKGYTVYPVNPRMNEHEGVKCYPSLKALPRGVEGALLVIHPVDSENVVKDARAAGIQHVWFQQGAESKAAVEYCKQNGMSAITGECIMMFIPNTASFHRYHRFVRGIFGGNPR